MKKNKGTELKVIDTTNNVITRPVRINGITIVENRMRRRVEFDHFIMIDESQPSNDSNALSTGRA